jgi:PPOX class probable F420-dependent enzyme
METTNTGNPSEAPVQEWSAVVAELDKGRFLSLDNHPSHYSTWLTTLNADGSPHVTAVGAAWDDGAFWFQTGDGTRKAKNIARDPRCAVSVSVDGFDVVVEGTARKVTDPDVVARIAEVYSGRGGWPAEPDESGRGLTAPFNAPGLGPPPWFVYRVDATSATSVLTAGEEGGSTRWRF